RQAHDQQSCSGGSEGGNRSIEPVGLALTPIIAKCFETRAKRTVAAGFAGPGDWHGALNLRNRRRRRAQRRRLPVVERRTVAGIAACVARAARAPAALPDRGQSSA